MLRTVISVLSIAVTFKMCFLVGGVPGGNGPAARRAWARREQGRRPLPRLTQQKRSGLPGGQRVGEGIDLDDREAAVFTFKTGPEDRIDCLLRVAGGMNDQPVIVLKLGNPLLDVSGGVAVGVLVGDACDSAKEGRAHLGYQFLFTVKLVAETIAEGAIEAAFMSGRVNQFMKKRVVVMRCIDESSAGGHVHGIRARPVIGAVFVFARQMKGGTVGPSGQDGFAGIVGFNFV